MGKLITSILKFFLFFGLGFAILYYVYQGQEKAYSAQCKFELVKECTDSGKSETECQELAETATCSFAQKIINDFKSVNYFWIILVMVVFLLSNVSRALRWNMLIKPLGFNVRFQNTFWATMAGYLANMALPRFGEVVKPGLVTRYEGVPLEKLIGTIVIDRLLDVICLACVIGLAFLLRFNMIWSFVNENAFEKSGDTSTGGLPVWLYIVGGIFGALVVFAFIFRNEIKATVLYARIKNIVIGFWEGIQTILKLERVGLFLFYTVFIWLMYYLMTYFCFFAFAPTSGLSPITALVVFVFGSLGIVVPSPGGVGSYQYFVTRSLELHGFDGSDAFSYSMIAFVTISAANVIFGLIAFIVLPLINKNKIQSDKTEEIAEEQK